jgi:hypothetical protein
MSDDESGDTKVALHGSQLPATTALTRRGVELAGRLQRACTGADRFNDDDRLALAQRCLREAVAHWLYALELFWDQREDDHREQTAEYAIRATVWAIMARTSIVASSGERPSFEDIQVIIERGVAGTQATLEKLIADAAELATRLTKLDMLHTDIRPQLTELRDVLLLRDPWEHPVKEETVRTLETSLMELASAIRATTGAPVASDEPSF